MDEVYQFIKAAQTYYLATVDGDQPRVRPFGTVDVFEGKLYIQTGRSKDVAKQIAANPKVELSTFANGVWLRVAGTLVDDTRLEPQEHMLAGYPDLRALYTPGDGNCQVLYFAPGSVATFYSFTSEPRVVTL